MRPFKKETTAEAAPVQTTSRTPSAPPMTSAEFRALHDDLHPQIREAIESGDIERLERLLVRRQSLPLLHAHLAAEEALAAIEGFEAAYEAVSGEITARIGELRAVISPLRAEILEERRKGNAAPTAQVLRINALVEAIARLQGLHEYLGKPRNVIAHARQSAKGFTAAILARNTADVAQATSVLEHLEEEKQQLMAGTERCRAARVQIENQALEAGDQASG